MKEPIAHFERLIIRGILKGIDVRRMMASLSADFFETIPLRNIFKAIQNYYERYIEIPHVDVLINELYKAKLPDDEMGNTEAFLTRQEEVSEDRVQYAFLEVEKAYLSRTLKVTMKEALQHIDAGDPKKAQNVMLQGVVDVASKGREITVLDFASHFKERREAILRRQANPDEGREIFVPTGIQKLDYELAGGLRKGELGLMLAPPESGKSISLQDISMSAVLNGFKVALFTIEMTPMQTAYRLDARLTQIKYRQFRTAEVKEDELKKWEADIIRVPENALKVIGVPEGCSCRLIESELSKMASYFIPDLVAVDYVGIMSPNEGRYETNMDWKYIGSIIRDLKALALKLNIPVWSASQLLVGSKQKAIIGFKDIGLARQQIAAHSDICIAIIQTEQMKLMDVTKLQFVKIREGSDNREMEIQSDYDRISLQRRTEKTAEVVVETVGGV